MDFLHPPPAACVIFYLSLFSSTNNTFKHHAMAQAVSHRPVTAEARDLSLASTRGVCGVQSGIGTGVFSEYFSFPLYHYTDAPYSFTHLSPTHLTSAIDNVAV